MSLCICLMPRRVVASSRRCVTDHRVPCQGDQPAILRAKYVAYARDTADISAGPFSSRRACLRGKRRHFEQRLRRAIQKQR